MNYYMHTNTCSIMIQSNEAKPKLSLLSRKLASAISVCKTLWLHTVLHGQTDVTGSKMGNDQFCMNLHEFHQKS